MQKTGWSEEMALGVPELDNVHKAFFDDLTQALTVPDDDFAVAFLSLVAKVERDFQEEEAQMERIDYPGLRGHREQHARVLGALHHVVPHVLDGNIALGREAVELLPQWLLFHLATMDTALAFALDVDGMSRNQAVIQRTVERIRQGTERASCK